jgi:hypothetical protein
MTEHEEKADGKHTAWEQHNLSQLRYFRSLSLRSKMQAIESLAQIARRFQQMRDDGAFRSPAEHLRELPSHRKEP